MSVPVIASIVVLSIIAMMLIIGFTVAKLFVRTKKGSAFVKTGFGGEKVIIDGGAIILPILHEISWVSMRTRKIFVGRSDKQSLITKDKFRIDVGADFFLRVKQNPASVSMAAQSLGEGAMKDEALKGLLESKFVDALRSVAASMTMNELLDKREEFVQNVQTSVKEELEKNGVELESVSLVHLDQTNIEYFDPNNAFDAEGMTQLTTIVKDREKTRNDTEQRNKTAIQERNLEAQKRSLEITQAEAVATADQEKSIKVAQADREREAKEAEILAERKVEEANINKERAILEAGILKEKAVEIANQDRNIEIAKKSEQESAAQAAANDKRAEAVAAEQRIKTAEETEIANRDKKIAIIKAEQAAEELAVGVRVAASAEKMAAEDRAEAIRISATADADAVKLKADAHKEELLAEATGQEALNNAQNKLSPEIVRMNVTIETIRNAAPIIEAMMKPVEKIEGIKVMNIGGISGIGSTGTGSTGGSNGSGNMMNDLFSGLMNYQATLPFIKDILSDAGIDTSSPAGIVQSLKRDDAKPVGINTDATPTHNDEHEVSDQ